MTRHINPSHVWDTVHGEVELRSDHLYDLMGLQVSPSYIIYRDGDLVKAKNGKTGVIEFSGSDAAEVIQSAIDALPERGGKIFLRAGDYSPFTISRNFVIIEGEGIGNEAGGATRIVKDSNISGITIKASHVIIRNIHIKGLNTHTSGQKGSSGEDTTEGIKIDDAEAMRAAITLEDITVYDCGGDAFYLGENKSYMIRVKNCRSIYNNGRGFYGSTLNSVLLENCWSQYGADDGFRFISCTTVCNIRPIAEKLASGKYGIYIEGDSGHVIISPDIENLDAEAIYWAYGSGLVVLGGYIAVCGGSLGAIYLGGWDGAVLGTRITDTPVDYAMTIYGKGNLVIVRADKPIRNNSPKPETNTIQVNDGRIFEGVKNGGVATFSGDGSTTQFTITHGVVKEPTVVNVTPLSADAAGDFYVTKDSTYIYVNYLTAPPSGTDNVILSWRAEI